MFFSKFVAMIDSALGAKPCPCVCEANEEEGVSITILSTCMAHTEVKSNFTLCLPPFPDSHPNYERGGKEMCGKTTFLTESILKGWLNDKLQIYMGFRSHLSKLSSTTKESLTFWSRVEVGAIKCPHADMSLEERRSVRLSNKLCFSAPYSLLELDTFACAEKEIENNPVPEKSFLSYTYEFRKL